MATTVAELIILGLLADWVFRRFSMPGLIGMLLLGVGLGPYVLGWIAPEVLAISSDLRMICLIVILLRAGFEMSWETLLEKGRPALLLSFVPAVFEGIAVTLLGPPLLHLTLLESAILGAILSAVSPAVVVPLMIRFIEEGRGVRKGIPTLLLAGSSLDDVFVIVVYSILMGVYVGARSNIVWKLVGIPVSVLTGVGVGGLLGVLLLFLFRRYNPRATKRVLIVLGLSIFLVRIEKFAEPWVPFAALLAVMTLGVIILKKREHYAHELSAKLGKIWVLAEIILFTMVGAQVNIHVALRAGLEGGLLIFLALIARSAGTYLCVLGTNLTLRERIFVVIAYIPKATVQAAIGGAPLIAMKAAGMSTGPGEIILAVAVLSILLTAPIGAWLITFTGRRFLEQTMPADFPAYRAAIESEGDFDLLSTPSGAPSAPAAEPAPL
ncbi:MAG: sodium:proton antiporter [Kiritimatiellaeota bacterium]|nr:sodium:proton antiporter [Kiritimatiellota bacterium]